MNESDRTDELVALVALVRSHLIPREELASAVDYYGSAATLLSRLLAGAPVGGQHGQQVLPAVPDDLVTDARSDVEQWIADGLKVQSLMDPAYPPNLLSVHNRPPWLFFEGNFDPVGDSRAIAVVGTRTASTDGIQRARRLSRELVHAGYTVISGLAKGIDAAAHIAALQESGRTVAVMGTGIRRRYPKQNAPIATAIVESGSALVSPFLPDQPPTKWTFPSRNVVMSGMCLATVVVEAGETSGAKMQAEAALYHGRSVFLPSSLVDAHDWAKRLITIGMHETRAVEVSSTDEIVKRLELDSTLPPVLVA